MRDIVDTILTELGLDYRITLVSGGEGGNYEIVMWDRPRNSYFSVRVRRTNEAPRDVIADSIRGQLRERIAAHNLSDDRRPVRRWSVA